MTRTLHQAMRYDKRGDSPQLRFNTYKGSDGIWTVHRQECLCHWTMHTDRSVCATTAAADVINCKWLKLAPPLEPISHSERQIPLQNKPAKDTAASEIHDGIRQNPVQCCAAGSDCDKNKAEQ